MNLLILIPAYNEEENIVRVIEELTEYGYGNNYIIINDGSSDDTKKICVEHGYNLLDLPVNLGLAGGFQAGVRYAYEHDYDAVLQLDGDGQHDPRYIRKLMEVMSKENADIVIGSRFVDKEKRRMSPLRSLGSSILRFCIKLTTGKTIYDPTSGMRLYDKNVMHEYAYNMNYFPEPDTISYLIRKGIKVEEVQVDMRSRTAGVSYLNPKRAAEYMIKMCVSILFIQAFRVKE